ncbi:MAG: hypothetical protein AAGL69_17375 [Pseudomonadota bacterium]
MTTGLLERPGASFVLRWLLLLWSVWPISVLAADGGNSQADTFPFERFLGVWTLEDDAFYQVWDGKTVEQLSIPGHLTECQPVNTDYSILCVVSAGELKGHILWVASNDRQSISHLSHFGDRRVGVGEGALDPQGHLSLKIRFEDEPAGTYRLYTYRWVDEDRYEMKSTQYTSENEPTGNWYGGTFVRYTGATN